jgi:hypothetical protein
MSSAERIERLEKIEKAIVDFMEEVGTVRELSEVTEGAYTMLGTAFFSDAHLNEFQHNQTPVSHTPRAEIVMAVHNLIEWSILKLTAERNLKLLQKKNFPS